MPRRRRTEMEKNILLLNVAIAMAALAPLAHFVTLCILKGWPF
ncbi:hypothetical protein SEA_PUREGLOBE5_6 [Arthrobacter phage Pureglobe5]|nr:membrane protein [Arthrobacter phage Beagle]QOP66757.1 hypothetical protein SEA_ODYSSEY395_6 [Arthrobacter phage Odyssey395]UYL87369.1 hypothetical protein SEA_PUREGLOBE5_6 [Arthrobacter phage Pureglobe5]